MLSLEVIILILTAVFNIMLVWLVLSQGWRSVANRYFALVASFSAIWTVGTIIFFGSTTIDIARFGLLLFYVGPIFMLLALCLFATVFHSGRSNPWIAANIILGGIACVLAAILFVNQGVLTADIVQRAGETTRLFVHPGWYSVYSAYFTYGFLIVGYELFTGIRRNKGYRKQQLIYITWAMGIVILLASFTNITMPILGTATEIWVGPMCTFFAVVIITMSIIKHALFDIKLAAVRSAAYVLALGTLAFLYYITAYLASTILLSGRTTSAVSVSPVNVILALFLAFLFQPIKHFFDRITDDVFYRKNYRSEDFFAAISSLLTSTTDLRSLLERLSQQIATTLKAEQAFFFVYYGDKSEHHVSAGTRDRIHLPIHDAHMLDRYVHTIAPNEIIFTDFISTDHHVRRMLLSHDISVVIPLRQNDVIVGYLLLGDHRSSSYTKRDINALSAVRSELVIAIQNALSLHEVQELNATLQQRIDVATKELRSSNAQLKHLDEVKDEFMSMASHQLRTPLTSVKGYISMVLEGDAGKITPQQHKLLIEAFKSSERMVGLIADFLNVSRLQTGRFVIEKAPFDLREVVQQEVNDLQMIASSHDIKLRAKLATGAFPVSADEQKIRQVIMNFIDNAIYYSHPKDTIVINLEKVAGDVAVTVVDSGIGVPESEQSHLFNKFFRAKNARKQRPDGTGVGLYLARRVVTAHDGRIIFSSKEGKGSTFGFRLPLVKEKPAPSESRR